MVIVAFAFLFLRVIYICVLSLFAYTFVMYILNKWNTVQYLTVREANGDSRGHGAAAAFHRQEKITG